MVRRNSFEVDLTPQQHRVLGLIAEGRSTKQLASALRISERTAQWHVSRLLHYVRQHAPL